MEVKRGNMPFIPFCRHAWRGVTVPLDFLFLGSARKFFLRVHICVQLYHASIYDIAVYCSDNAKVWAKAIRRYNNSIRPYVTCQNSSRCYSSDNAKVCTEAIGK